MHVLTMRWVMPGWIGVDFDGTLATDNGSKPVGPMVERVKRWLNAGIEVRLVTARVNEPDTAIRNDQIKFLGEWCRKHLGQAIPMTYAKDYEMYQLWDDRAIQVEKDTGIRVGNLNRSPNKPIPGDIIDEETGYIR